MKILKSIPNSRLNFLIYILIICLSIGPLIRIWEVVDKIIVSPHVLTDISLEWPLIRITNDVYFNLKADILGNDQPLYQRVQRNALIYSGLEIILFLTVFVLILMQLKNLIISIREESFYNLENFKSVKTISVIIFVWVLIHFILYQSIQLFVPHYVIQDSYNYVPVNKSLILGLLFSIDFKMLLSSFAFYIISIVFKEGYELKMQSDLTI